MFRRRVVAAISVLVFSAGVAVVTASPAIATAPIISIGSAGVLQNVYGNACPPLHTCPTPKVPARFAVTLSEPSTSIVSVHYAIEADGSGSALPGDDFVARSATVTFDPSARTGLTPTTKYVTAMVLSTGQAGPDATFRVVLSEPTGGYALGRSVATGTIFDQGNSDYPAAGVGDATVIEGNVGKVNAAKVTVTLPGGRNVNSGDCTMQVALVPETASAQGDFKAGSFTVTFHPRQWQKAIRVIVYPDTVAEPDETVSVVVSNSTCGDYFGGYPNSHFVVYPLVRSVGTITILNDD